MLGIPQSINIYTTIATIDTMAYGRGNRLGQKKPLFFFYDCEATDLDVEEDRIVEVAAVIHLASLRPQVQRELRLNDNFSSLCYSDRELGEVPQRLTGLTRDDLRDEPPLEEVLTRFFEWMEVSIATANRLDHEEYTPVLVAHGGNALDFLLLDRAIQSSRSLKRTVHRLNLRYLDSYPVFIELQQRRKLQVNRLNLQNIYSTLFRSPLEAHRALADAQALCRIFSESHLSREINVVLKFIQNREEMSEMEKHLKNFEKVPIKRFLAYTILAKGITYQVMCREYGRNPEGFRGYLRRCGINRPKPQQIEHFRAMQ